MQARKVSTYKINRRLADDASHNCQGHVLDSREESPRLAVDEEDFDGGSPEDATYCPSSPETDGQGRQHDDSDVSGASYKRRKVGISRHTRTENTAKFEEWPLQNAVLKRVSMEGIATFQVQFDWDPRLAQNPHASSSYGGDAPRKQLAVKRANKRARASRVGFTQDEDDLLVKLKEGPEALSWACIHKRFSKAFPGRSVSSLQVHYCTKLKVRARRSLSRQSQSANSDYSV
jgi:hypothetical protein